MAVNGFYWLLPSELAGCGRPGGIDAAPTQRGRERTDEAKDRPERIAADLSWLRAEGIRSILSLTEAPLPPDLLEHAEFGYLHLAVDDLTAPTPRQLQQALGFIDWQRALGRPVVVHCRMGQGRTGTVLAAYLVREGMTADAAMAHLRRICSGALSSASQERALHAFARRRDWVL
ncbi:MAG TPA: dual specificity protein phosphatase family protein [Chloroflexota bacterium]|jgi:atypical dual specificity phosphatase|nr:dual specificity protein phosphatase family protein [Chloroflexota bacterium]